MALHRITHLKAPWPSGATVGDVIELDTVPAWAVGKCVPAPEATEPTVLTDEQRAELQRRADADALAQEQIAARLAAAEREQLEREAEAKRAEEAAAAQRAADEAAAAQAAAAQQQADKPTDPAPADKPAKGKAK